jgi:hypothetical protein
VSRKQLKQFPLVEEDWEENDFLGLTDLEAAATDTKKHLTPEDPPEMERAEEDNLSQQLKVEQIFYVERIMGHQYRQKWLFMVKWQNWPLEDSTWEPFDHFVNTQGEINKLFVDYCVKHNLENALLLVKGLSSTRKTAMEHV